MNLWGKHYSNNRRKFRQKIITYIIDTEQYLIMLEAKGNIEVCYNNFIRTQSAKT